MQETEHYKLTKDAPDDFYDVAKAGANMDKIDAALDGLEKGKAATGHNHTKEQVGLGNVPNVATNDQTPTYSAAGALAALVSGEKLSVAFGKLAKAVAELIAHIGSKANPHGVTAAQVGALSTSQKGAAGGVAELDSGGKVPAAQLPSYVDDVLEYAGKSAFPAVGENGKIYVAQDTNLTWRWSGSAYVEISPSLALGETSGTAYRGDRGKIAYDHSQATGNAHGLTLAQLGAAAASHTHSAADVTGALKQFGPVNVTIPVSGWSGAGPWTQNVAVSGVLAAWDWKLKLSLQKQTVTDTRKTQEKAMGCVTYCETYNGGITLTCYEKKPETNILAVLSGEV